MSELSSLLTRDQVVSPASIEQALQRQVLDGGDLETILLEMDAVDEDVLSAYRAATFGLLPASREEVMKASRQATRSLSRTVAERTCALPLARHGDTLLVAVSEPPEPRVRDEVASEAGCQLAFRVVTETRLRAALTHHYGIAADARTSKLVARLRDRDPGVIPFVRPLPPSVRRPVELSGLASGLVSESRDSDPPAPTAQDTLSEGEPAELSGAVESHPRRPQGALDEDTPELSLIGPEGTASGTAVSLAPVPINDASMTADRPAVLTGQAIASGGAELISSARDRAVLRIREAADRAAVVHALLQAVVGTGQSGARFDLAAAFAVTHGVARGQAGLGSSGLEAALVGQELPLAGGGAFEMSVRTRMPVVGVLASPEERALAERVGLQTERPYLLVPFLVGARPALLLLLQRYKAVVGLQDAVEVISLGPSVSSSLRRLIEARRRASAPPVSGAASEPAPASAGPTERESVENSPVREAGAGSSDRPGAEHEVDPEVADSVGTGARTSEASSIPGAADEAPEAPLPLLHQRRTPVISPAIEIGMDRPSAPMSASEVEAERARDSGGTEVARASGEGPASAAGQDQPGEPVIEAEAQVDAEAEAQVDAEAAEDAPRAQVVDESEVESAGGEPAVEGRAESSSVIVDLGAVTAAVVERLCASQPGDTVALADVLTEGEAVLPMLAQRFPGPEWIADLELAGQRASEGSSIAAAFVAFGATAGPYLAGLLRSLEGPVLVRALHVAREVVHLDLLDPLLRIAMGQDARHGKLAFEALSRQQQVAEFPALLKVLGDFARDEGAALPRRVGAVEGLGAIGDGRAFDLLMPLLLSEQQSLAVCVSEILTELTCQDFGQDYVKWASWGDRWVGEHRVLWLIEALGHEREDLRARAVQSLQDLTQVCLGYHPRSPRKDRVRAQRQYLRWWQNDGRCLFETR